MDVLRDGVQTPVVGAPRPDIRETRAGESGLLRQIEAAAGRMFAEVGLAEVAADPPLTIARHAEYRRRRRSWVATDDGDRPVAFLVAALVDGNAHVDEVAVDPSQARRGIGRALIDHLADLAATEGRAALTLTTFVGVPWNAPYYRRCGFHLLNDAELGPELAGIRRSERDRGLDRAPRTAMIRWVPAAAGPPPVPDALAVSEADPGR